MRLGPSFLKIKNNFESGRGGGCSMLNLTAYEKVTKTDSFSMFIMIKSDIFFSIENLGLVAENIDRIN